MAWVTFITWLATNTSGVPRAQARRVVALGLLLGLVLGLLTSTLVGAPVGTRAVGVVGGVLGGATLGALGAALAARLLDWAARLVAASVEGSAGCSAAS